ncbi:MAG: hypothetical protein FWC34_03020 [Bacteroidetes bacterium]|nr:hypothetical protein [Bacteroidota bacterium]MCL2303378.1 hypothetical protein [Lentimicrobiaceae bacterium]
MITRLFNICFNRALIILFLHVIFTNTIMLQAQNTRFPVGAIPSIIDVSPMGAATYTIPIEIVPGTQGMQPNLSIVYNSFSNMGLLGMKWDLAGLSAITRCGQSLYYDGNITAIQFNDNDRFALDGDHLLRLNSGVYGAVGGKYATEMEDFTRIVSYNGTTGHPIYFIAYTDNGNIIEYGNTTDSKQKMENTENVLSWLVSKITDANGNYMTFEYQKWGNELCIKRIFYTKNDHPNLLLENYAKVEFSYTALPDMLGNNTYFVGGFGIPQTRLLDAITISYNSTMVRKYKFRYNHHLPREHTTHLQEMILYEYEEDGTEKQLNPTNIVWGEQNTDIKQRHINLFLSPNERILTGDFNGNGYDDLLVYNCEMQPGGIMWKGWKLFMYDPLSDEYYEDVSAGDDTTKYYALYVQDINGDGIDELIIHTYSDSYHTVFKILSLPSKTQILSTPLYYFDNVIFGDFDGDGSAEIVFAHGSNLSIKKIRANTMVDMCPPINLGSGTYRVRAIDANGNGKKNIQVIRNNGTSTIYEFNGFSFQSIFQGNLPFPVHIANERSSYYYGDLNGDGITDVIAYCEDLTWKIYISKGDASYDVYTLNNEALDATLYCTFFNPAPEYPILVADLNGDGKDDIVQMVHDDYGNMSMNVLLSKGWVNGSYIYKKEEVKIPNDFFHWSLFENIYFADIRGNGKVDLLIRKPTTGYVRVIDFNKNNDYDFVHAITDGIRKRIELSYKHKYFLAEDACSHANCPYHQKKYFLSVVDSIRVSSGFGNGLNTWQYLYDNATYSSLRKTFLGFKKFTCINKRENKKDEFLFYADGSIDSRQIMIPFKKMSFYNGKEASERRYITNFQNLYNTNVWYYDRFTFDYRIVEEYDKLSNTTTVTENLFDDFGRLTEKYVRTHNGLNPTLNNWMHQVTKTYSYETIILDDYGNQKKTVPQKILTTQQYETTGILIADTLTYGYYKTGSDKGRLNWMRKGNIHGTITTNYQNYTPAGLYGKQTISAENCAPRTEIYEYDNTQRFVTKVKSADFTNFETNFTYDPKTGNKLSETNLNELTTTYSYNNFGNFVQIDYPDNIQTNASVHWYTSSDLPNARYYSLTTSTGKPELRIYYDILGREICRKEDGNYFEVHYNNKGQVAKISFPFQTFNDPDRYRIWHEYTYDDYGRVTVKKVPYTHLSYTYNNRKVTITDHLRSASSSKDYDALGRIINATDNGGAITYAYSVTGSGSNIRHQTTIATNGATTTIYSDLWGNRRRIDEPNAGTITSEYNKLNELVKQTDARGNIVIYQYDALGRVTQKQFTGSSASPMTIKYTYDNFASYSRGRGKIYQIFVNNVEEETFFYDNRSRLSEFKKVIDYTPYTFHYGYTPTGQLETLMYPDNFAINYSYSSTGKLTEIRNWNDDKLIYKVHSRNKFNAPTRCEYGNGIVTDYTYNTHGLLTRIKTGNKVHGFDIGIDEPNYKNIQYSYTVDSAILNYRYTYDDKGLMISRSESMVNRLERYEYDKLDRLTQIKSGTIGAGTMQTQTFSYHNNGNIINNSSVGFYAYQGKPHAVTRVEPIGSNVISQNQCDVTYNFFNQPTQITEGTQELLLSYGSNRQRNKTERYGNHGENNTRYYINKYYEKERKITRPPTPDRNYRYIYGDNGVVALHTDSIYYIHTDHLGSYCAITNANKQVVMRNYFDPWGNTLSLPNLTGFTITNRGFTGHEHYPDLKIINMNGRLYDPVIGRFFSPDHYVQLPGFTQSYNRYSYALNNPLKYIDPSGQWNYDYDDYRDDGWDDYFVDRNATDQGDPWVLPGVEISADGDDPYGWSNDDFRYDFDRWPFNDVDDYRDGGSFGPFGRDGDNDAFIDPFDRGGQIQPGDDPPRPPNRRRGPAIAVSFNRGIPQFETNFINKEWGAITPGPFIIYEKGGASNPYYNKHEPGHIIQLLILGKYYYPLVALPSLFTATFFPEHHNNMPWEKTANQLWYWLTGEYDSRNPVYFKKK